MIAPFFALTLLLAAAPAAVAPAPVPTPAARAAAAGVPAALAQEVAARAADRGADADALLAPVVDAAQAGLPVHLVAEKVLEGLAKGAPPERISAVARALADRLAAAKGVLELGERHGLRVGDDARPAQLADLAGALQDGVDAGTLRQLVDAAHRSGAAGTDGVVTAARVLADLHRRGVPVPDALPLAQALASRAGAAAVPEQLGALYEAWRAEGGQEARAFLEEARRRVAAGASLDGMVDRFGESPDRLVRLPGGPARDTAAAPGAGKPVGAGAGANGNAFGHGDVPGLSDGPPGRGKGKGKGNGGKGK